MSKALKALLKIKNADTIYVGCVSDIYTKYPFECKEIEKSLKALEIIKEKQVNIGALLELDSLQQYNDYCDMVGGCKKLTQEEYDILKEVLL